MSDNTNDPWLTTRTYTSPNVTYINGITTYGYVNFPETNREYVIGDVTLSYNFHGSYYGNKAPEYKYITYSAMLAEEGHLIEEDKTTINKMLESKDEETVKFAVELVKNKTKWLGCYMESVWVIKNYHLQSQILDLYNESKHGKL